MEPSEIERFMEWYMDELYESSPDCEWVIESAAEAAVEAWQQQHPGRRAGEDVVVAARNAARWKAEEIDAAHAVVTWWDECVSEPDERGVRKAVLAGDPVYFRGIGLEDILAQLDPHEPCGDALTEALDRAAGPDNVWWPHAGLGNPELEPPEGGKEV